MYIYLHAFHTLEHLEKFRLFPKTNGFYDWVELQETETYFLEKNREYFSTANFEHYTHDTRHNVSLRWKMVKTISSFVFIFVIVFLLEKTITLRIPPLKPLEQSQFYGIEGFKWAPLIDPSLCREALDSQTTPCNFFHVRNSTL